MRYIEEARNKWKCTTYSSIERTLEFPYYTKRATKSMKFPSKLLYGMLYRKRKLLWNNSSTHYENVNNKLTGQ